MESLHHYTDSLDDIEKLGRNWGLSEGAVYAQRAGGNRFARGHLTKFSGEVVFEGQAASLFRPHPVKGWFSGLKRLMGQHKAAPYTVAESNFTVNRIQPRGENKHAVFRVDPRESMTWHFEQNLDKDGNPIRAEIELGLQDETVTEVQAGLEEGDEIIIRGREGAPTSTPQL